MKWAIALLVVCFMWGAAISYAQSKRSQPEVFRQLGVNAEFLVTGIGNDQDRDPATNTNLESGVTIFTMLVKRSEGGLPSPDPKLTFKMRYNGSETACSFTVDEATFMNGLSQIGSVP